MYRKKKCQNRLTLVDGFGVLMKKNVSVGLSN